MNTVEMAPKKKAKRRVRRITWQNVALLALLLVSVSAALTGVPSAMAQTPVPIVIDTNEIFSSTNTWIEVFVPIMAIGIGIAVALAILTFIGNQILKAFRGGGR